MCVVSMIYDHYWDRWNPYRSPPVPEFPVPPTVPVPPPQPAITPEEIEEFRKLLERAREYDRKHNQPDCELEEKREKLRQLAKELGVEIEFL